MASLQTIFEEVSKNEMLGLVQMNLPIIPNEVMDSFSDSFNYEPDAENYLLELSDCLQIQRQEQQQVFHLLDRFILQYLGQIKQHQQNPNPFLQPALNANIFTSLPPQQQHPLHLQQQQLQQLQPPIIFPEIKTNAILAVPQKKRQNFSREITNVLTQWLYSHCGHPYPSEHEKSALCQMTGLSLSQVSGWFINARRRKLKKINDESRDEKYDFTLNLMADTVDFGLN